MNKHITIQSGDYVLLSDIPNEQVFNLVKECFVNAGFRSTSMWEEQYRWSAFYAAETGYNYSCFVRSDYSECDRQLSLSDVFNSTNGNFKWECCNAIVFKGEHNPVTVEKIFDYKEKPNTYKISRAFDVEYLGHADINSVQGKATGKSTAHHLELISKAMKSPEQWVEITSDNINLQRQHRLAFDGVRDLCHKLNLDWMEFDLASNSLRYMPYQTVKMVTKWERVE